MVHMNWCEQEKHWKHGDAGSIHSDTVVHVLCVTDSDAGYV